MHQDIYVYTSFLWREHKIQIVKNKEKGNTSLPSSSEIVCGCSEHIRGKQDSPLWFIMSDSNLPLGTEWLSTNVYNHNGTTRRRTTGRYFSMPTGHTPVTSRF